MFSENLVDEAEDSSDIGEVRSLNSEQEDNDEDMV